MARTIGKLTPANLKHATKEGLYGDGGGLWLNVGPTGGRSWLFRFMLNGRAREMGLGPLHAVGLADARERARNCRRLLVDGIDPLDARKSEKVRGSRRPPPRSRSSRRQRTMSKPTGLRGRTRNMHGNGRPLWSRMSIR